MLEPYASQVLSTLTNAKVFYILPVSEIGPYNSRVLPREVYVEDVDESAERESLTAPLASEIDPQVPGTNSTGGDAVTTRAPKKKGRPSKRDIAKRAKEAVAGLDRWLERTDSVGQVASAGPSRARGQALLSHAPTTSRANYGVQKARVLGALLEREGNGVEALERANLAVLGRLKKIDAMAAEKGMEVGGEGGELTGLGRVERAAGELAMGMGGILGLSQGAGRVRESDYIIGD